MSKEKRAQWIATSFGLGFIPVAPGTFGAAGGLAVAWLLSIIVDSYFIQQWVLAVLTIAAYFAGVWSCNVLHKEWGKDPSKVVIDETVGFWISIFMLPVTWQNYLVAFVLFRFFDIAKPLGIRNIDKMNNAHSVMLDDVAAGVMANILIQIFLYVHV